MTILNNEAINSIYFYPQASRCEDAIEVDVGDAVLRCHYHRPNPRHPTLVHFHGNAEAVAPYVSGEFPNLVQSSTCGMNTLMIEYRGYGGSTGDVEMVSMLSDGEAVLKALNVDPAQSIAYGRSIGSLYAIELAHRCPTLAGLVIDSGIADIRKPFLEHPSVLDKLESLDMNEVETEIETWFNHEKKISQYTGDLLLFHTKLDGLIDVDHAYSLNRWATSSTKQLRVYDNGNHNTIFQVNHSDMMDSIGYMAERLFPECKKQITHSIRYRRLDSEIGVEVGCPIENARRREESARQREREMQAIKERGPTKEMQAMIDSFRERRDRRTDEPEVPKQGRLRSMINRILSKFY